eukprot:scpid63764/ scgid22977/ 
MSTMGHERPEASSNTSAPQDGGCEQDVKKDTKDQQDVVNVTNPGDRGLHTPGANLAVAEGLCLSVKKPNTSQHEISSPKARSDVSIALPERGIAIRNEPAKPIRQSQMNDHNENKDHQEQVSVSKVTAGRTRITDPLDSQDEVLLKNRSSSVASAGSTKGKSSSKSSYHTVEHSAEVSSAEVFDDADDVTAFLEERERALIEFMQEKELLPRSVDCAICKVKCELIIVDGYRDMFGWKCPSCPQSLPLHTGSRFCVSQLNDKLSLSELLDITRLWCGGQSSRTSLLNLYKEKLDHALRWCFQLNSICRKCGEEDKREVGGLDEDPGVAIETRSVCIDSKGTHCTIFIIREYSSGYCLLKCTSSTNTTCVNEELAQFIQENVIPCTRLVSLEGTVGLDLSTRYNHVRLCYTHPNNAMLKSFQAMVEAPIEEFRYCFNFYSNIPEPFCRAIICECEVIYRMRFRHGSYFIDFITDQLRFHSSS